MGKRVSLLGAALIALVLAVQFLVREEPASVEPPADTAPDDAANLPSGPSPLDAGTSHDVAPAGPSTVSATPTEAPRAFERRLMFDCGGDRFYVRIGDDSARLLPPGSLTGYYIPLARMGAAWRGRYANEDILFRQEGDVGTFQLGEHTFDACVATRDRAALVEVNTGVTFQGFGHSPTWTFEIVVPEGFVLTTQLGARYVVPFREPIDSGGKITFRSVLGTQELVAVVDRIACFDAPSGETFANAVTVTFDGEWYYGCGRFITYR